MISRESFNTILGYLGIGIVLASCLVFWDGRISILELFLGLAIGFGVNVYATVAELKRNDGTKQWLNDVMGEAFAGDPKKALKKAADKEGDN